VDLLVSQECTVLAGVPSSFQLLLRACSFATRPTPSLRLIQQAGGKLSPVLVQELLDCKPTAALHLMYGQTEATARLSVLPPQALPAKLGSIGRGIPGVELSVLDDDGRPVGPGQMGEIYARGENVSPGYFGDAPATLAKFTPRGLRTGDLAVVDDDGYLFVVDRRDDFIKSWGHRISSHEVEACALRLRDLVSAAAVGVPDDEAGEAVALVVTAAPGSDAGPADVLAHCRRHLPKYMVPRRVLIVDALPLNASGKVDKREVREVARAAAAPAVAGAEA
jgi:acyl-CoA synthetase (AMP-forming)/AMP-acid ligase II